MHTIKMLITYFGKFPDWAPLFFETIKRNKSIDFVFYTDCDTDGIELPNVQFKKMTFDEYISLAQQKTGVNFKPANPYKLCDLRPLYPVVHYDDIKDTDFYGWADMDLLFGDIRSFYTDEILKSFDVLSTHSIRISGHMALFRNTPRNRNMYRRIYKWKEKLEHPYFVGIDEHGITNAFTMTIFDKFNEKFNTRINNSITRYFKNIKTKRHYFVEQYTTPFFSQPWLDGTRYGEHPDEWYYKDGDITNSRDKDRKFIYIHFMNFKNSQYRHDGSKAPWEGKDKICFASKEDMTTGILINKKGIYPLNS
jgi:hypothetical protein